MKRCNKCLDLLDYSNFSKRKVSIDGLSYTCKPCCKIYNLKNKSELQIKRKIYQNTNKEKLAIKDKQYYEKNKNKRINQVKNYIKSKRKTDINFKLKNYLRNRLYCAIKAKAKKGSAVTDLGCSVEFLKEYLTIKFQDGMSWDNYGKWHIDHIKPLASFNLEARVEFLSACHYTNLQPLWAQDNIKKGVALC